MKAHTTSGLDLLPTRSNARPMNQGPSHTGNSGLSSILVFDGLFGRLDPFRTGVSLKKSEDLVCTNRSFVNRYRYQSLSGEHDADSTLALTPA